MFELVVEVPLVLHRAGHDHIGSLGKQVSHAVFVPRAVGQLPPVIVGVDCQVASSAQLSEDGALPRTRHSRHQHTSHGAHRTETPERLPTRTAGPGRS